MGTTTAIAWTDHTFNPWIGCTRVSPGCEHCYAETLTRRTGMAVWGKNGTRTVTSDGYWKAPEQWNRAAAKAGRPALVFCASLADVFEDRDDLVDPRARLFDLIGRTPQLMWQLLTKRPENVARLLPDSRQEQWLHGGWPDNVWIGTTVEDQQRADVRLPILTALPARTRFVSCEPLIGPVDLAPWLPSPLSGDGVEWVIVGGESGPGYRRLNVDHAQALVDQVEASGVPVFFKQVGGVKPSAGGDLIGGRQVKQFPSIAAPR
jgi:protein gp37